MNQNFILRTAPKFIVTGLLAGIFIPTQPVAANDLLQDIGIGAATNLITGEILDNGSGLGNTVKGAATGAAVNATHNRNNNSATGTLQDAAVGAATNAATGVILDDGSLGENAATGAAAGALINILK